MLSTEVPFSGRWSAGATGMKAVLMLVDAATETSRPRDSDLRLAATRGAIDEGP